MLIITITIILSLFFSFFFRFRYALFILYTSIVDNHIGTNDEELHLRECRHFACV